MLTRRITANELLRRFTILLGCRRHHGAGRCLADVIVSMYRCSECEDMVDNDYHPCTEDTRRGHRSTDLLCPECAAEIEERSTPQSRQGGVFTQDQLDLINLILEL